MIISIGWGIIPPVFPVAGRLLFYNISYYKNDILISLILMTFGITLSIYTGRFTSIYNLILIGIIFLYQFQIKTDTYIIPIYPLIIWCAILLFFGSFYPQIPGELRFRFYGGEINFTAFHLIMLALCILNRGQMKLGYLVLILTVILTLSRSALVVSIFIVGYNIKYKYKFFILLLGSLCILFLFTEYLNQTSGFAMGYTRLLVFSDSSSMERLFLNKVYGEMLLSNYTNILFGVKTDVLNLFFLENESINVVHNSYIFKAIAVGIPITIAVIIAGFMLLPRLVMYVILIYSLTLHSLLSPALFLLLSFLMKKEYHGNSFRQID